MPAIGALTAAYLGHTTRPFILPVTGGTPRLVTPLAPSYPIGPDVTQIESTTYALSGGVLRRAGQVLADDVTGFDLVFIDQAGTQSSTPGTSPRSVVLNLSARQAAPSVDTPKVASSVSIEAHLRNLAMRWDAG